MELQPGQTYNLLIYKDEGGEQGKITPFFVFKEFVCISNNGLGCASKGAWHINNHPAKDIKDEPWVNPLELLKEAPDEFHIKDIRDNDDVDFLVKMIESCSDAIHKARTRSPAARSNSNNS